MQCEAHTLRCIFDLFQVCCFKSLARTIGRHETRGFFTLTYAPTSSRRCRGLPVWGNVNKKVLHFVKEKLKKNKRLSHTLPETKKNFARCHRRCYDPNTEEWLWDGKKTWHFQEFIILITSSFITIPHHHKSDLGQLISPQKATFHALRWCEYRGISSYIGQPPIIGYRGHGCAICAHCQKIKTLVQRLSLKTTFQLIGFNLSTKNELFRSSGSTCESSQTLSRSLS